MEEKNNLGLKNSNKKKVLIIILVVLAVALIILAIANSAKNNGTDNSDTANTGTNQTATSQTDVNAVTPVTGEVTPSTPTTPDASGTVSAPTATGTPAANGTLAAGAPTGTTGTTGTTAAKPEAPIEKTNPVTIKMTIDSTNGFNPASFDVKAGQQVTLSVTANGGVAILVFDGGLSAAATGISNGQTKDITFTAPVTRGAYSFHNDIPGRNQTCKINVK